MEDRILLQLHPCKFAQSYFVKDFASSPEYTLEVKFLD